MVATCARSTDETRTHADRSPTTSVAKDAQGKPEAGTDVRPLRLDATDERIASLKVPQSFAVNVFARDLGHPRMLATGDDGTIYVSRPDTSDVVALKDGDGDGRAEQKRVMAGPPGVHGIAVRRRELWMANATEIYVASIESNGSLGLRHRLIRGLPGGKEHLERTLGFGPDDMLYVSVGSSCNACAEVNPQHATILRIGGDAKPKIFARGLRNTIGFDWHPDTHELWGMDNGTDGRGDDAPPEELNRLREGADYGWPYAYGKREVDTVMDDPPSTTKKAYAEHTEPAALEYQAHSAPIAMVFYRGTQFPPDYRGDAFVAMHGSWNRDPPTGYKVVRIRFDRGAPIGFEDFLSGFLVDAQGAFGRPTGLAVAKDGALLVSDDSNGLIYRVSYETTGARADP